MIERKIGIRKSAEKHGKKCEDGIQMIGLGRHRSSSTWAHGDTLRFEHPDSYPSLLRASVEVD